MVLNKMSEPLKAANVLLSRALDLEAKGKLIQASILYQEGLQNFIEYLKVAPKAEKAEIRRRVEHFMNKAEKIQQLIDKEKKLSTYHEEVAIADNEMGHSYDSVFGHLLTDQVKVIKVEDPYIRSVHQYYNFTRLCELIVKKCSKIQEIILVTIFTDSQYDFMRQINASLQSRGIRFVSVDNKTLHDRQISLSNGWVIKLGRGLDYFKAPGDKFSLGTNDMDLRPCHQTKIDMYYTKDLIVSAN